MSTYRARLIRQNTRWTVL